MKLKSRRRVRAKGRGAGPEHGQTAQVQTLLAGAALRCNAQLTHPSGSISGRRSAMKRSWVAGCCSESRGRRGRRGGGGRGEGEGGGRRGGEGRRGEGGGGGGLDLETLQHQSPRMREVPFDLQRRMMSVVLDASVLSHLSLAPYKTQGSSHLLFTKGAPLDICSAPGRCCKMDKSPN